MGGNLLLRGVAELREEIQCLARRERVRIDLAQPLHHRVPHRRREEPELVRGGSVVPAGVRPGSSLPPSLRTLGALYALSGGGSTERRHQLLALEDTQQRPG